MTYTIHRTENLWILDVETTLDHRTIHCVVVKKVDGKEPLVFTNKRWFRDWMETERAAFIGHNIIGFDAKVLNEVWGVDIAVAYDTLIASRLWSPSVEGGHSLKAWGERLNFPKQDNDEEGFFDKYTDKMREYCINDVELTLKLYNYLNLVLERDGFLPHSVILEHRVAQIIQTQKGNGFKLNRSYAMDLITEWNAELDLVEDELILTMEPTIKVLKTKIKTIPFNPGSRDQIAERLIARGWKPEKFTPTGKPVVDDEVLQNVDIPEAKKIYRYLLLQKRMTQVRSWLDAADKYGYVHGDVITNGAVTGRMTHSSPNMAQIPAIGSLYGKECRECWIATPGYVLVGIDASGLELRMLAHYMNDPDYTETVINGKKEDGTDIHSVNMRAAGLSDRDQAKTFIYAFLYGAGAAKIGSIIGGTAKDGTRLIGEFLQKTPALAKLKDRVAKAFNRDGLLKGLDGRKLRCRSEHSALNTLLQGAGAIVMKQALVILENNLKVRKIDYRFVANVHDEWQIEVLEKDAQLVGMLGKAAIAEAGKVFALNCPLDGDYAIGKNWAETH